MNHMLLFLLTFANEQDREKFEYLYSNYKNLMLHKAYDILKDYMLAEDAASEAFLRVYKNLHKISDPSSNQSIAFLVTIVKNVSLTMLAREKKQPDDLYDDEPELADIFDLEAEVLSTLSTSHIYMTLEGIGEELKSVFLFKYAYDMSHKEIGQTLGITENNVTVRLHRAKKKLAAILKKEGYVHESK